MIDPKRTAIIFTANSPQLKEADLFIDSLFDENKGNFKGDLWVISTGLNDRAKQYLKARDVKYYVNPMNEVFDLRNWERIARAQPEYSRATGTENERLRTAFFTYRNKRMSKLILLDWARLFADNYDYVVMCDNDLYIQNDIHVLFEKVLHNPEAIWYWREEYPSLQSTIIQRQNFHYKRLQEPTPVFMDDNEINIGFLLGRPSNMVKLFSDIKTIFYRLNTELLERHGWQDQAITRVIRAYEPGRFQLFDEGDIVHLCNGGRHTVKESPSMDFLHVKTKQKFTVVHFASGKQKYFPPISFSLNGNIEDFYSYSEHQHIRSKEYLFNCWDIINTPSKYCSKDVLTLRNKARSSWITKTTDSQKKRLLASGFFGVSASHVSIYDRTKDFWQNTQFDMALMNNSTDNENFGSLICEGMPEIISSHPAFIKDTNLMQKMGYKFSNIPFFAISEAVDVLIEEFKCSEQIALAICNIAYMYFKEAVLFYKPDIVVILAFQPSHRVFRHVCNELNIPFCFVESGVLDGTFSFDILGSMGTSWVAQNSDYFNSLAVSNKNINEAKEYIDYYRKNSQISRNKPEKVDNVLIDKIKLLKNAEKKIILCIGSYDAGSGNVPYSNEAKLHHAPFYRNNKEMVDALIAVAKERNDIHIIYKQHPIARKRGLDISDSSPDLTIATHGSIPEYLKLTDLTVVLLSQSCYVSLLNDVPVIMVGRNQINGSGAVYDIADFASMDDAVTSALKNGFSREQKYNFLQHIARLLRYYVYSYVGGFGRPISQMAHDLLSVVNDEAPGHLFVEVDSYKRKLLPKHLNKTPCKGLFSVIVLAYNELADLTKTLASIRGQAFKNCEVICLLGRDTSKLEPYARYFSSIDSRISYVIDDSNNTSKALNDAIKNSSGSYLYFMQAGDSLDSDGLETIAQVFDETEADCIYSLFREICPTYNAELPRWYDLFNFIPNEKIIKILPEYRNLFIQFMWPWMKAYKKDFFVRENLFFGDGVSFSKEMSQNLMVLFSGGRLYCLNKVIYNHVPTNNKSMRHSVLDFCETVESIRQVNDYLKETNNYLLTQHMWVKFKAIKYHDAFIRLGSRHQIKMWSKAKELFNPSDTLTLFDDFTSAMTFLDQNEAYIFINAALMHDYKTYKKKMTRKKRGSSRITKIGNIIKNIPAIFKKIPKGIKCINDHGLRYTLRRAWDKFTNKE